MTNFSDKVRHTIGAHSLLQAEGTVIVTVSGGADSVALLAILLELGYNCVAAHCNFHLRGDESNRDMHHVEELCSQLDVDLYIKDFDVAARRKETGESLEMACRELRYKWFFELLDREYAQAIAVGHHREDQIETFMLNLMRGSGVAGLAGMRHRNEHVVRPLLDCSRREIEQYLTDRGLGWITDSSNASDDFARNRLRNRLLPLLAELFPGASDGILKSMAILRENSDIYTRAVCRDIAPYIDADSQINLAEMQRCEPFAAALLYEHLRTEGFNRTQTDGMLEAATRCGGHFTAGQAHVRDVDHGYLRPARAMKASDMDEVEINPAREIFAPLHIRVTHHDVAEFKPENNPHVIYLDEKALRGRHRWTLRRWRRGDRMTPYGMSGSKLVSDIFAAAKLSAADKETTWLMTRDDSILWVAGIRASSAFAIGPSTRRYIRLELVL